MFGWLFALSAPAFSSNAYIGINLILRAGPDTGYPRVMTLPAGTYVEVHGCLSDYTWCDVGINGQRGWVAATYLQYYYGGSWVYLPTYGPRIGVPVVTFVLGIYWSNHYRHTRWYHNRAHWERSPPRNLPPPRRPPSFHPRIPPPARPMQRNSRPVQRDNRRPAMMRPAAPIHRPAPTSPTSKQRKPARKGNKAGGHGR
jgi:uncharacterized protein YraI